MQVQMVEAILRDDRHPFGPYSAGQVNSTVAAWAGVAADAGSPLLYAEIKGDAVWGAKEDTRRRHPMEVYELHKVCMRGQCTYIVVRV